MKSLLKVFLVVSLASLVASPSPSFAQGTAGKDAKGDKAKQPEADADANMYNCGKPGKRFRINFKPDVELKELLNWAMGFSCKAFVIGGGVGNRSAKVTIMTPRSLSPRAAWRVFLVALASMNVTIVPKGDVLEVVEKSQAKNSPLPLYTRGRPGSSEQMVRVVMSPKHLAVNDLSAVLQTLKSKDGEIKAVERAGVIIVTDYASHVSKMGSLLLTVDRPVIGERLYMIKVKSADAGELAQKLTEILGIKENKPKTATSTSRTSRTSRNRKKKKKKAASTSNDAIEAAVPSKIMADERSNSLIVLATEPAYLRVKALVNRLDYDTEIEGGGQIHVYPLENADSEEMANTLTSLISGIQQSSSRSGNQRTNTRTRQPTPQRKTGTSTGSSPAFQGDVRVTHDKPTNSLVVVASIGDYLSLRQVIRKLDIPRRQVYIEAHIVEVSVDSSRQVGTAFHGGTDLDNGSLVIGGVQHSELNSLNPASLAGGTGLLGGIVGPLLNNADQLLGTSIPSFGALFQLLATNSSLNVLSAPHIITTDNEEAEISVGQNIPYQSALGNAGIGGQGGAGLFPTQSVQRQDVALTLKVTPHVNATGMIRLQIELTIQDIASENFGGLGPSWSNRSVKDTVVVRDQQAIAIGGLMQDRVTQSESKVPFLGDIPILGYLFKYKTSRKEKRNLLVLLTPYVVQDQLDLERIVEKRTREQREFVRSFSTFQNLKPRGSIDYRRKRGLIEEINQSALRVEREKMELEEQDKRMIMFDDGPIDYLEADGPDGDPMPPEDKDGDKTPDKSDKAKSGTGQKGAER